MRSGSSVRTMDRLSCENCLEYLRARSLAALGDLARAAFIIVPVFQKFHGCLVHTLLDRLDISWVYFSAFIVER